MYKELTAINKMNIENLAGALTAIGIDTDLEWEDKIYGFQDGKDIVRRCITITATINEEIVDFLFTPEGEYTETYEDLPIIEYEE